MRSVSLSLIIISIIPAVDAFHTYSKLSACHHSKKSGHRSSCVNHHISSMVVSGTKIHRNQVVDDRFDQQVVVDHGVEHCSPSSTTLRPRSNCAIQNLILATSTAASILLFLGVLPAPASAVSGGGLDYAGLDISGRDFSNGEYKGKDFTQTIAKGATFAKSNLQGCRFYKAYLVNTNFEGADARGASFEDTSMDNANLRNIDARGSYFGQSLLDVQSMEGGDFTDAQIPVKTLKLVCGRDDVKGTNPTTGADTRESLMCL